MDEQTLKEIKTAFKKSVGFELDDFNAIKVTFKAHMETDKYFETVDMIVECLEAKGYAVLRTIGGGDKGSMIICVNAPEDAVFDVAKDMGAGDVAALDVLPIYSAAAIVSAKPRSLTL